MGTKLLKGETIAGPRKGITIEEIEKNLEDLPRVKSEREAKKAEEVIEGLDFNFGGKEGDKSKMLIVPRDCDKVTIRRCWFRNKANEDPALVIASKNVVVEECIFENMTGGDAREAIRIAYDGRDSGVLLNCRVTRCVFRNNSGDDEIISIKSTGNTIEDCFFINNDGNVTVRHGGSTEIHHNYFKGNNGVRIHGYGNLVEYNYFEDNKSDTEDKENMRCPISVWWGDKDYDPNWIPDDKEGEKASRPSDKFDMSGEGTHSMYARAVGTVIRGNRFKNCKNTIVDSFRRKDAHDKEPFRTIEEDNM
jgi:hypothetical protein